MVGVTISEILERVESFERMLAEFYASLSEQSDKAAICLLADYISRHRCRTMEALGRLPASQLEHVRNVRLRYPPAMVGKHNLKEINISPEDAPLQILHAAMEFDECLIRMYKQIVRQPIERRIRELFESLIRREENDKLTLRKIRMEFA